VFRTVTDPSFCVNLWNLLFIALYQNNVDYEPLSTLFLKYMFMRIPFVFFTGMEMQTCGKLLQIYLTTSPWRHWCVLCAPLIPWLERFTSLPSEIDILAVCLFHRLSQKYFACMVDYHHPLRHLITSVTSTVSKKFLMKVRCVIFFGLIQMIDVVGVFRHVVLGIPSDRYGNLLLRHNFSVGFCWYCNLSSRIYQSSSTILIT
jgi:hypothetical protein